MALGVKIKNIKTQKEYSIEDMYNAIKDTSFSAGVPSLTKHGLVNIITFPPLDSQNQVWVVKTGLSEKSQKFSIQKGQQAGMDNMAKNMVLDKLTGGFFGFGSMAGKTVKECERLVEETAKELEALNL